MRTVTAFTAGVVLTLYLQRASWWQHALWWIFGNGK